MENKDKITFLDLVFPICCIYLSGLFFWAYFIKGGDYTNPLVDVVIIMITSTFFTYGIFAFFRDLKRLGIVDMIKNFLNIDK